MMSGLSGDAWEEVLSEDGNATYRCDSQVTGSQTSQQVMFLEYTFQSLQSDQNLLDCMLA